MTGVLVNTIAIAIGSLIGMLIKNTFKAAKLHNNIDK